MTNRLIILLSEMSKVQSNLQPPTKPIKGLSEIAPIKKISTLLREGTDFFAKKRKKDG